MQDRRASWVRCCSFEPTATMLVTRCLQPPALPCVLPRSTARLTWGRECRQGNQRRRWVGGTECVHRPAWLGNHDLDLCRVRLLMIVQKEVDVACAQAALAGRHVGIAARHAGILRAAAAAAAAAFPNAWWTSHASAAGWQGLAVRGRGGSNSGMGAHLPWCRRACQCQGCLESLDPTE